MEVGRRLGVRGVANLAEHIPAPSARLPIAVLSVVPELVACSARAVAGAGARGLLGLHGGGSAPAA